MSYTAQPTSWDDCLAIRDWLKQWITAPAQETILAGYLVGKDRFGFESYLLGVMGAYWTNLTNQQRTTIWNCAYRCYKVQEKAKDNAIATDDQENITSMPSTNSIRW